MTTPWDKLYGAAVAAERAGDPDKAAELHHLGQVVEQAAEREAAFAVRRAGSNAFRSDAEEKQLREENQQSFYRGGGRER